MENRIYWSSFLSTEEVEEGGERALERAIEEMIESRGSLKYTIPHEIYPPLPESPWTFYTIGVAPPPIETVEEKQTRLNKEWLDSRTKIKN